MSASLGEEKLSKNLSSLKKNRLKGEIKFSFYVLVNKWLSFFTKNSPETKVKTLSKELAKLKYENGELKKKIYEMAQEKKGIEKQIDDLLHKVDLNEFQDLKQKALVGENWEKKLHYYQSFLTTLETIFAEIEVNNLLGECLIALGIAKDNFQKLKVIRQFLLEFKRFAGMETKLSLFYKNETAEKNIKNIPLVTETLKELQEQFDLDKKIAKLKKDFKSLKDNLAKEWF